MESDCANKLMSDVERSERIALHMGELNRLGILRQINAEKDNVLDTLLAMRRRECLLRILALQPSSPEIDARVEIRQRELEQYAINCATFSLYTLSRALREGALYCLVLFCIAVDS